MSTLTPCPSCHRHVKAGDACPFCGEASVVPPGGFGLAEPSTEGGRSETTIYGMPAVRTDLDQHVPAPHYGMPPPRMDLDQHMPAPHYGMPPGPVFTVVAVTAAVGGAVAYYVLTR